MFSDQFHTHTIQNGICTMPLFSPVAVILLCTGQPLLNPFHVFLANTLTFFSFLLIFFVGPVRTLDHGAFNEPPLTNVQCTPCRVLR